VSDNLGYARPIELQRVPFNYTQSVHRKRRCEQPILFNRNHLQPAVEQYARQCSPPWSNLEYGLTRPRIECVHDPAKDPGIVEKMLAQPSQTLSRTSVRSSLAGAPPVYAAISVNTASRMWRAGRPRRFTTWLNTRCSPNRSPLGPRASANPSVKRHRIALPRSHFSTRSWPPSPSPSGGRLASSRLIAPSCVETRNACG